MLVVFDLDGTLVDSSKALLEAHDVAWSSMGLARPPTEAILELVGLPLLETMNMLNPDADAQSLAERYSQAYAQSAETHEELFDGMRDLLALPFRAAVATGKSQNGADRAVKRHGLETRFEIVLGGNSVPRPKPHPDMLQAIMAATGVEELVMIGDTTYDLEMAHAAGVRAVGVSWGHHSVERLSQWAPVVNSVDELRRHLGL